MVNFRCKAYRIALDAIRAIGRDDPALVDKCRQCGFDVPSLVIRGMNFGSSLVAWAGSGFQRRTEAEIAERLAICQNCDQFSNDHCNVCGCACVEENRLVNKLALKGQKCPMGKWT